MRNWVIKGQLVENLGTKGGGEKKFKIYLIKRK